MANTKLADMTASSGIEATDLLYTLKDPAGTPLDRKATGTQLAAFIVASVVAAAADTQVLFRDGTGISGDAGLTYIKADNTLVSTAVNAASSPAIRVAGTWFSGGSATTTKPQVLIEATGATSTAWSTSGTGLGVNAASGFAGNLINVQVNGSSKFAVDALGDVRFGTNNNILFTNASIGGVDIYCQNTVVAQFYPHVEHGFKVASTYGIGFVSAAIHGTIDAGFFRDAAGIIAQRNGANAQTFRVYNTYTDASNYERGSVGWVSNVFRIETAAAGTGTARNLNLRSGDTVQIHCAETLSLSINNGSIFTAAGNFSSAGVTWVGSGNSFLVSGETALTNTVQNMMILRHNTFNTPAAGIGCALVFQTATVASGNYESGGIIESVCTDVGSTTEDFDMVFKVMAGGAAAAEKLRILSTGDMIMVPPTSAAALGTNGQLTIEATANTTLTFKYRGSDNTTRSGTITLA